MMGLLRRLPGNFPRLDNPAPGHVNQRYALGVVVRGGRSISRWGPAAPRFGRAQAVYLVAPNDGFPVPRPRNFASAMGARANASTLIFVFATRFSFWRGLAATSLIFFGCRVPCGRASLVPALDEPGPSGRMMLGADGSHAGPVCRWLRGRSDNCIFGGGVAALCALWWQSGVLACLFDFPLCTAGAAPPVEGSGGPPAAPKPEAPFSPQNVLAQKPLRLSGSVRVGRFVFVSTVTSPDVTQVFGCAASVLRPPSACRIRRRQILGSL